MGSTTATQSDDGPTDRLLDRVLDGLGMPAADDLDAAEGEALLHTETANRTQNRRRAVGGRLYLTDRRLLFRPHGFDARLSGERREIPLSEADGVDTRPPTRSPLRALRRPLDTLFGGGLRTRLRVETADGDRDLFVVSDPEATAERIRTAIADD